MSGSATRLRRIAYRPRLGRHAHRRATAGDAYGLRDRAQNPSCPTEVLELLSAHPDAAVRLWARARLVGAALDDDQRHALPVGLRNLLT